MESVISVLSLTAATAEDPSEQVLGEPSVVLHFGGMSSAHFGGVPVVAVPSAQIFGAYKFLQVGVFPSLHAFGPISFTVFEVELTAFFPSAQVAGFLPSEHAGSLPSVHFTGVYLKSNVAGAVQPGFFLSEQYGISPFSHFVGPCLVSVILVLSTPLESTIFIVSLVFSLAFDPSAQTAGGMFVVHAGLDPSEHAGGVPVAADSTAAMVQMSGFLPPAHVGKAPSAHLAGPVSFLETVVALLGSEPSLHKFGLVIALALPHAAGLPSEHVNLMVS